MEFVHVIVRNDNNYRHAQLYIELSGYILGRKYKWSIVLRNFLQRPNSENWGLPNWVRCTVKWYFHDFTRSPMIYFVIWYSHFYFLIHLMNISFNLLHTSISTFSIIKLVKMTVFFGLLWCYILYIQLICYKQLFEVATRYSFSILLIVLNGIAWQLQSLIFKIPSQGFNTT